MNWDIDLFIIFGRWGDVSLIFLVRKIIAIFKYEEMKYNYHILDYPNHMNYKPFLLLLILLSVIFSCKGPTNYKDASIVKMNNHYFIKLKGRGSLHPASPINIIIDKTYEDSVLIPLPYLKNGIYKGSEIRFDYKTYVFTYEGSVSTYPGRATVNLHSYDSVEKQTEQYPWNGEYHLINY